MLLNKAVENKALKFLNLELVLVLTEKDLADTRLSNKVYLQIYSWAKVFFIFS